MIIKSARMLAKALIMPSPRRMAAGVALGLAVGIVPKGNLLAIGLMTVMCCLNVNIVAGLLTAVLVSLISFHADPLFHAVGHWLLTQASLQSTWTWIAAQPISAWTNFNNTVVLGSFTTGVAAIVPTYWLTLPACRRFVPAMSERVQRWKITRWLTGASIASRLTTASK